MFVYNCIQQTYATSRDFWITRIQSSNGTDSIVINDLALYEDDSVSTIGYIETGGNKDIGYFSIDLYGNVLLKKRYSGDGTIDVGTSISRVPFTTNFAVAGQTNTVGTVTLGNGEALNLLISSISGSILWKTITGSTSYEDATDVKVATYLETEFVVGNRTGTNSELLLLNLSSAGVENWKYKIVMPESILGKNTIALESTWTYFYVTCCSSTGMYVFKFSVDGTLQWQRKIEFTGIANKTSIELDSSNNVYIASTLNSTKNYGIIAKFDSSGTLLWQKLLDNGSGPLTTSNISIKGNDLYYVGLSNTGSVVIKFDLDATMVWERDVNGFQVTGLELDSGSNPVMSGTNFSSLNEGIVVKLPSTGPATGTYGGFDISDPILYYYSSTYTLSTPVLVTEVPVITTDTITLTTSNASTIDTRIDVI